MDSSEVFSKVCAGEGWREEGNAITVDLAGGRRQVVYREPFLHQGEVMQRLYTRVGPMSALSETRILAVLGLNFSLLFGALATYGDDLVLVETMLLRETSPEQLALVIAYLAETADGYEMQIYGKDDN